MKISKYIIIFSFLLFFCNCSKSKLSLSFDKVEHYSLPENDSLHDKIYLKRYKNLTSLENDYLKMRDTDFPSKIRDTTIFSNLEKINFRKRIIPSENYADLREIFDPSSCTPFSQNACAPTYRDIYIFKNHSKIVAVAKVCFECEILHFVDYKESWQRFGDCIEFDELKGIN